MRKSDYKKRIIAQTQQIGTYSDSFLPVIDTLAGILEQRDKTHAEFTASGGKSAIAEGNKRNPLLVEWENLNTSALQYWRDLGLTPAGLKKIDEKAMKHKKRSAIAEALSDI